MLSLSGPLSKECLEAESKSLGVAGLRDSSVIAHAQMRTTSRVSKTPYTCMYSPGLTDQSYMHHSESVHATLKK